MRSITHGVLPLLLALVACDDSDDSSPQLDDASVPTPTAQGPMTSVSFTESDVDLVNPERGYYVGYDLRRAGSAASVRDGGRSVAISVVKLPDYRDRPLDAALLDSLRAGFAAARAAGIKLILRFSYNSAFDEDAPKSVILGHIAQLAPLLQENADVIAVMQAGFIGAWGEWHGSTNGLDNDEDRLEILEAILAALPPSRGVQVRRPTFKDAAYPGGPLEAAEAYDGSARSRVGHHNDCFLASPTDYGTYPNPVSEWQAYVAADGRFTAIGGETCAIDSPRSDCENAVAEMDAHHWSYLNSQYNQAVLAEWVEQGCDQEISQRLGYRFALEQVGYSEAVAPGGELELEVALHNSGFASPYNRRPVEIVLSDGSSRRVAQLVDTDARLFKAGTAVTIAVRLRIPADVAAGRYTLSLRLPDEAASLTDDPRYTIALANDGVWDDTTGDNILTRDLVVDPSAPGPRDPSATDFIELR
jgi:hypothetical protein